MFVGLPSLGGVAAEEGAYLATFTFRASADAAGTFVLDVADWPARGNFGQQSFLTSSDFGLIQVESTTPAVIVVTAEAARSIR